MINPVKLAKDNGLWPAFEPFQPKTDNPDEERTAWRDETRNKIRKLVADYTAWAKSEKGVIDDPGEPPEPIALPVEPPQPCESPEVHREFRRVTDAWFDSEYMTRYLPETELWSAANALWAQKQSQKRAEKLTRNRKLVGVARFVSYALACAATVTGLMSLFTLFLPGTILPGIPTGIGAVLVVFLVDYAFNKLEDRMERRRLAAEEADKRAKEAKAKAERQRVLQRLGVSDSSGA